jgi:hypothetical protein
VFTAKTTAKKIKKMLMSKEIKFVLLSFVILIIGQSYDAHPIFSTQIGKNKAPTLEKIWETDTLLTANESVVYDKHSNAIYVSCMGKPADVVDGDGFIAKIDLKGNIENLHWVKGLNCPKGLAIKNNKLFVIDLDELVSIDLPTGKILSKTSITGWKFFNDIDIAKNGDIFLSECYSGEIIRHKSGVSEKYYSSAETSGLNGVHVVRDHLLFNTNDGNVYALSKELQLKIVADSCFRADGLEQYKSGFFCSSWQGKIYYFEEGKPTHTLIDTWGSKQYAGDIDVVENKKMLICPTLMNNKVVGYKIKD